MDSPSIELPFQLRNIWAYYSIRPTPATRIHNVQLTGGSIILYTGILLQFVVSYSYEYIVLTQSGTSILIYYTSHLWENCIPESVTEEPFQYGKIRYLTSSIIILYI